jgi:hypothetical protein
MVSASKAGQLRYLLDATGRFLKGVSMGPMSSSEVAHLDDDMEAFQVWVGLLDPIQEDYQHQDTRSVPLVRYHFVLPSTRGFCLNVCEAVVELERCIPPPVSAIMCCRRLSRKIRVLSSVCPTIRLSMLRFQSSVFC